MKRVLLALMVCAPLSMAVAETGSDPFVHGDVEAGAAAAAVCAACHGPGGKSAMPAWPKLAGQGASYTYSQLTAFKSGDRKNPVMQGQAAPLDDKKMRDLAAYFMAQEPAPGVASEQSIEIAEPIYRGGLAGRGIPACAACHGPTGAGNPAAAYPRIGGQHADYLAVQLRAYRAGERATGAGAMMASVAAGLTDAEIDALASYINGLR